MSRSRSSCDEFNLKLLEEVFGDIFGVDVIVFFVIFSEISLDLISFVRLFSSSFISLDTDFLGGGVACSDPLLGELVAPVDLRVLTVVEEEEEEV